jgi:hypothetical protein
MRSCAFLLPALLAATNLALAQDNKTALREGDPGSQGVPPSTNTWAPHELPKHVFGKISREWAPPQDRNVSIIGDERSFILLARSDKAFSSVWAHYASKLGIEAVYYPNDRSSNTTQLQARYINLNPKAAGVSQSGSVATATFALQEASGRSMTVSLVEDGASTLVSVSVASAPIFTTPATSTPSGKPQRGNSPFRGGVPGG